MVKHSLRKLLDKYPYFLDKRTTSNLYKVTDVNNSIFRDLYNSLFHTYESFHLNKRLLVWRTQSEPYVYQTHFCCSYPNIRTVEIYKNDTLIRRESFTEEEEKTDYCWTYECSYIKTNMLPMKVYLCLECEDLHENDPTHTQSIYFGDDLPLECHECGSNVYLPIRMWECNECGEIYFANLNDNGELDITCKNNCNTDFTEVYAYKCLGEQDESEEAEQIEGLVSSDIEINCGELYIGSVPPTTCKVCGVSGYEDVFRLYYNDDTILINDNSTEYYDNVPIVVDENTDLNHINTHVIVTSESIDHEGSVLRIPFPFIPDDKFKFSVETWDEYYNIKGYPENDVGVGNEFDHDYSLDELGDLNNIPRKQYDIVEEHLYPLTEPPYNKYATEDDYHYMKRMIEYNLRLWGELNILDVRDGGYTDYIEFLDSIGISLEDYNRYKLNSRSFREEHNPVSLELWKKYSVPSRLVNRERLLLKLFDLRKHNGSYKSYYVDENDEPLVDSNGLFKYKDNWEVVTDLAECWIPQQWEHKDRFCNPVTFYGQYLYVGCDNLRPIPNEEVYFTHELLNSINEELDVDYYLKIYVYYTNRSKKITLETYFTDSTFILHASDIKNPTQIEFEAYTTKDDTLIDTCLVTLNPRSCSNADIYVDADSTKTKEKGTSTYPYKSLQKALDRVNQNFNVIALRSNITIDEELAIKSNTKIIGCTSTDVPNISIINPNSNKFFKIVGGKNCSLTLSNLSLQSASIVTPVSISSWVNKNNRIDDYTTVITRGGLTIINVTLDKASYYPTDKIVITGNVTDREGNRLGKQKIRFIFDNEYIAEINTKTDGTFTYTLNTDKIETGFYDLELKFISDTYFSTTKIVKVDCTKQPNTILSSGGSTLITSTNHSPNIDVNVYIDGEAVMEDDELLTIPTDNNGNINYNYTLTWGKHIIVFRDENGNVLDMVIVETIVPISKLVNNYFIKDFSINDNGVISYDRFIFTANHTFGDLNNALKSLAINEVYLDSDTLTIPQERFNTEYLLASECEELKNCITNIGYNDTSTVLSYEELGEFWL